MPSRSNSSRDVEFIQLLRSNKNHTPNEFTIGMGKLIRAAREERGMSQVALANEINRRPATISSIENGKSEIGVLTLVLFAIELQKPISYFFPESLLKEIVSDVKTPFEYRVLEVVRGLEYFGGQKLALDILKVLLDNLEEEYTESAEDLPQEEEA